MGFVELSAVLGNLGEFVGSFAVLATLVYLAVQVSHSKDLLEENRKIALSHVYQARADNRAADLRQNFSSSEYVRFNANLLGISEDELRQRNDFRRSMNHLDNVLYQNELGLLNEVDLDRIGFVVVREYPRWEESEIFIPDRVTKIFKELASH